MKKQDGETVMNTERREEIKELLRERGEVKLKDLEQHFPDCSSMT